MREKLYIPEKIVEMARLVRKSSSIADALCRLLEERDALDEDAALLQYLDEAFSPIAPSWAVYPPEMKGERCGMCKAWCTIVRPGKTQCDNPNCIEDGLNV